jgi:transcriptional regulator with XRE-family HTH domain
MSTLLLKSHYYEAVSERTETLRDWILTRLVQRDWRQADLARAIGVSAPQVSRWINGKDKPTRENCRALSQLFDTPYAYVLSLAGHEPDSVMDIDLSDPLISFAAMNQDKISLAQKLAMIEFIKQTLRLEEEQ